MARYLASSHKKSVENFGVFSKSIHFIVCLTVSLILSFFLFGQESRASFQVDVSLINDRSGAKIDVLEINESRTRTTYTEVEDPDKFPLDEDLFKAANFTVEIYARVTQQSGWNLLYNNNLIKTGENGRFVVRLPLRKDEQWFDISGINDSGKVQSQRIGVRVVNLKEFVVYLRERRTPIRIVPQLGGYFLSYRQKNVPDLSEILASAGLANIYDLDPGNVEAHFDFEYFHPIVPPNPKVALLSYLKTSAYLTKYLEFESQPEQVHHFVLGAGFFLHSLTVDPRLFGYTLIGGGFGDFLTSFNLGRAYHLDFSLRYGSFPWGGDISGIWTRSMSGTSLALVRTFVSGAKLNLAIDLEQVTVDQGNVSLIFGGLRAGYTFQH